MAPSWRRSRATGDEARPAAVLLLLPQPVLLGRGAQDRGAVPASPALARVPALLGAGAGDAGRADRARRGVPLPADEPGDRKSTRLNSSHTVISYAVFCLKKKNTLQLPYFR